MKSVKTRSCWGSLIPNLICPGSSKEEEKRHTEKKEKTNVKTESEIGEMWPQVTGNLGPPRNSKRNGRTLPWSQQLDFKRLASRIVREQMSVALRHPGLW